MPEKNGDQSSRKSSRKRKAGAGAVVTLTCLGSLQPLHHQATAATAEMAIIAKLVRAIEVTINTSLNFGTLAVTLDRAGYASIDPALNRLLVDTASSLSTAGGVPQAGKLTVKGAPFPVSISVEDTIVALSNGVDTVTVNNFNFISANGGARVTITPQLGVQTFTVPVGATLNTKPGQLTGTYVGLTRIYANFQ